MNEDIFKGKWKELKGSVKEKWGDLTDDEITEVETILSYSHICYLWSNDCNIFRNFQQT